MVEVSALFWTANKKIRMHAGPSARPATCARSLLAPTKFIISMGFSAWQAASISMQAGGPGEQPKNSTYVLYSARRDHVQNTFDIMKVGHGSRPILFLASAAQTQPSS